MISVIKQGLNGVCYTWSKKYCQRFVNEFTFRLNERNCDPDTRIWLNGLFKVTAGKTIIYKN